MRAGIIQSSYIPWRGYFDFIDSVDLFLVFDDVQFNGQWRKRNRIRTEHGTHWLTVPVHFKLSEKTLIQDVEIKYSLPWRDEHLARLKSSYGRTPYFERYAEPFAAILESRPRTISELNCELIRFLAGELGITTPIRMSSEFSASGSKTDRLIDLMLKAGADDYVSGPSAEDYIEVEKFERAGIGLSYKSYDYEPYPQPFEGFEGAVTVLDLLFCHGPESRRFLRSKSPDRVVLRPAPATVPEVA